MRKPLIAWSSLAREVTLLLTLKAALLYAIWYAFFSQPVIPSLIKGMDVSQVSAAIVGPAAQPRAETPGQPASKHNHPTLTQAKEQ